jgi:hypothetical protein
MTAIELTSDHFLVLPHGVFKVRLIKPNNHRPGRITVVFEDSAIECDSFAEILTCKGVNRFRLKTTRGTYPVPVPSRPGLRLVKLN